MMKQFLILTPLLFLAACGHDEEQRTIQVVEDIPAVVEAVEEIENDLLPPPPPPPGDTPPTYEEATKTPDADFGSK
jgi:hypothetical protein